MITGQVNQTDTNNWGFTRYNVNGAWYGIDKKGPPLAQVGETVSFEYFDKPGKDGRTWPTIKSPTFRKQGTAASSGSAAGSNSGQQPSNNGGYSRRPNSGTGYKQQSAERAGYWSDKAKQDEAKEPRIAYFAALERAISFVDLALRNGAISAYEKAKATGKLEVLTALVYETAQKIMAESYAAKVPAAPENASQISTSDSNESEGAASDGADSGEGEWE